MIFYYGSEKFDKIPRNKNLICSSTLIESCAVMVGCRALCVGSQQTSHRGKEDAQKPSAVMALTLNFRLNWLVFVSHSWLGLSLDDIPWALESWFSFLDNFKHLKLYNAIYSKI